MIIFRVCIPGPISHSWHYPSQDITLEACDFQVPLVCDVNFDHLTKVLSDFSIGTVTFLPFATNQQSVGTHFNAKQISCSSLTCPPKLSIYWWIVPEPIILWWWQGFLLFPKSCHSYHVGMDSKILLFHVLGCKRSYSFNRRTDSSPQTLPLLAQPHPRVDFEKPCLVASLLGYTQLRGVRKLKCPLIPGSPQSVHHPDWPLKMPLLANEAWFSCQVLAFCLKEINPCLENHGGCDRHAECTQTGPNQVSSASAGRAKIS